MLNLDLWLWLVVSFVFFNGIATGALTWAAAFRVAQTRWSPAINRIGHAFIFFLPVSYVVMIILLLGIRSWVPWVAEPIPAKQAWLNVPFMVVRDLIALAVLCACYFLLVRWTLNADTREQVTQREQYRLTAIGVATVIVYTLASTVIAYDFIMSLDPEWVSTMFAPYYFCSNLYGGMAALILIGGISRDRLGARKYLEAQQFHDMGNLMLGFALFNMGLFFAQYLTIWYENLPWETEFLILRYFRGPWPIIGWISFFLAYGLPFLVLQSVTVKRNPRLSMPIAAMALVGLAVDRYILVVPSILPEKLMLWPVGLIIPLALIVLMIGAIRLFFRKYPAISSADAKLPEREKLEVGS